MKMSWRERSSVTLWDPEEQKRKLEQEVLEMKEKAMRNFLEKRLADEEKMGSLNNSKLVQMWRQTLRNRMNKQLKDEVLAIRNTFENILDKKDALAVSLVKDLCEDDMLHLNAFQSHIQTIDALAALQRQRIDQLARETEDQVNAIMEEFTRERDWIVQTGKDEENHMIDVCIAMEIKASEDEYNDKCAFTGERSEIKQQHCQMRQSLRLKVEARVDELWGLLRQDLALYLDGSEQRKAAFTIIRDKEVAAALEMQMRYNKIGRLRRQVAALRRRLRYSTSNGDTKNKKMKHDMHELYRKYGRYRDWMQSRSSCHSEKLTKLSVESHSTLTELKRQIAKAKRILKLAEINRKLETAEEKITPFYTSTLSPEEERDVEELLVAPPVEKFANAMLDFQPMENFWKRYNKVLLEKRALDQERKDLAALNKDLRLILKSYLNNISVNPEIMARPNSLLITSSISDPEPKRSVYVDTTVPSNSYHSIIEGAHVPKMNLR